MDNLRDKLVEAFLSRYQALGLTGTPATVEEVQALERQLGLAFPAAYKAFLLIVGRDGGTDFVGSDCTISHLPKLREGAEEVLRSCGSPFTLHERSIVFLMHQGYVFYFMMLSEGSEDPPVFSYMEGESCYVQQAETFSAWLALGTE